MDCPVCGTTNEPGRKFCGECGTALAIRVPVMRRVERARASSSVASAGRISATPGAAPAAGTPDAPTAERRLVSILFADLVGFTTLSESRDAETVRELLDRYFATATQIIGSYGGTIEKFIGDAVMAVWGAPTAFEDDAERAVRSALDLVAAVEALGAEVGAELRVRAGVLTGEAAVTLGATNQGMVAGDLVNTASRLQSVAPPGTVLVGEATYQAASDAIAFEPAGEQLLKGKTAPVPAYRALRVVARRGGAGRNEQLEAPFVGRGPELRMLKDFHLATGAERRPRLVSIIGQGGIGKSRLIWEFQKYLDGVTEVVYWHQGRSPGVRRRDQLLGARRDGPRPDRDHRRGRSGGRPGQAGSVARPNGSPTRRSAAGWSRVSLQLLGLEAGDGDERADRESLFAAWRVFFERIAEHGVVVLVFEDLQWADDGLLDFIDHVLDWSRERPIYIITLGPPRAPRPAARLGRRPAQLHVARARAARPPTRCASCSAVSCRACRSRSSSASSSAPRGSRCTPSRRSGCSLRDGLVTFEDGVYRPLGDLSELSVPASLHALIASRLDGLDAADRSLLQAASVIGKTFSLDALAAVGGLEPDELVGRLRALVRREMLTLEADPRSPEHGQYGFIQGLIREVAYGTLAKRDRRRMHVAAARYFESLDDEGIAGALAEHYLAAYRAQPDGPEGAAVAAQARLALRGAADRARSLGSYVQATRFLEQALEVTTDPAEQAQLHAAAGRASLNALLIDEANFHMARSLELARQTGDRGVLMAALVDYATAISATGRIADSRRAAGAGPG